MIIIMINDNETSQAKKAPFTSTAGDAPPPPPPTWEANRDSGSDGDSESNITTQ